MGGGGGGGGGEEVPITHHVEFLLYFFRLYFTLNGILLGQRKFTNHVNLIG